MRLYIAGRYNTGDTQANIAQAREAMIVLLQKGHHPFCPHMQSPGHTEGLTEDDFMRWCLAWLCQSQGIVMLPGWEDSPGARREYTEARTLGLALYVGADSVPNCNKTQ